MFDVFGHPVSMRKVPNVLIPDYNGFWCELSQLYWSQQSCSLISRHPLSSVEEVISQYCPQCLARYAEDEAAASMGCCTTCLECPVCACILARDENTLICSNCSWSTSSQTGPVVRATDAIMHILVENIRSTLVDAEKTQVDHARGRDAGRVWQMEELNMKLASAVDGDALREEATLAKLREASVTSNSTSNALHGDAKLAPGRAKLLTKKSVRSKPDARTGRMNILVQPKTLPLEGDSSLKLQKGKWWVKDSSAVHELPFISLLDLPSREQLLGGGDRSAASVTISITNPKISDVTVTFVSPVASASQPSAAGAAYRWLDYSGSTHLVHCRHSVEASRALTAPCSSADPAQDGADTAAPQRLSLQLGGFEDELLKDASGAPEDGGATSAVHDEPATRGEGDTKGTAVAQGLHQRVWRHSVQHNRAVVTIPVGLLSAEEVREQARKSDCAAEFELQLRLAVDLGGGTSVDLPVRIVFG